MFINNYALPAFLVLVKPGGKLVDVTKGRYQPPWADDTKEKGTPDHILCQYQSLLH